jgi:hypothetical protein
LEREIARSVRGLTHSRANYTAEIRYWKLVSFVIGLFHRCRTRTRRIVRSTALCSLANRLILHIVSQLLVVYGSKHVLVGLYINIDVTVLGQGCVARNL